MAIPPVHAAVRVGVLAVVLSLVVSVGMRATDRFYLNLARIDLLRLVAPSTDPTDRQALAERVEGHLRMTSGGRAAQRTRAESAIAQGDFTTAVRLLQALHDEQGLDPVDWQNLASAYAGLGNVDDAVTSWLAAGNVRAAVAILWDHANELLEKGQSEAARTYFEMLIQAASRTSESWLAYWISEGHRGIAATYVREQRWHEAVEAARTSLGFNACNAWSLGQIALADQGLGEWEAAGAALDRAIACSPENLYVRQLRADWERDTIGVSGLRR